MWHSAVCGMEALHSSDMYSRLTHGLPLRSGWARKLTGMLEVNQPLTGPRPILEYLCCLHRFGACVKSCYHLVRGDQMCCSEHLRPNPPSNHIDYDCNSYTRRESAKNCGFWQ
jgi:hypothetical protein